MAATRTSTATSDAAHTTIVLKKLFCGATSGAITKTCIAPLERVKIVQQIAGMRQDQAKHYRGMIPTFRYLLHTEGIASLWNGNLANVLRVIPVYGLKFGLNDVYNEFAQTLWPGESHSHLWVRGMLAGTAAGLSQSSITYPLEVIRTRLSLGKGLGLEHTTIVQCTKNIATTEGISGFYKGISATLVTGAPYVGLQMTSYTALKNMLPVDPETGKPPLLWTLPAGAIAGIFAQTVTYPGDTLRRRMQINGANGTARQYSTTWDCAKQILAKEGWAGMFAGAGTNCVRAIPGAAIQFFVYDATKHLLGL